MAGVSEQERDTRFEREAISPGQEATGEEETLELETNRKASQYLDSLPQQAIDNDRRALDELFARYRRQLYNRALRVMGNAEEAEDALQDGLLSAFRNLRSFKGHSKFSTWLTRIVINAALMRLRRIRPKLLTSVDRPPDSGEEPWLDRVRDPRPNPEEWFGQQERLQTLEQRLRALPPAYRQAVWLCDVQGARNREAAEALGVPLGTFKSQLHRARLRLSQEIAGKAPAPEGVAGVKARAV
jgi:RNA polymerase sigma-70 factor (ECF subfamily)